MRETGSDSVRMGRWEIASVPANWWFVPDFGLKHNSTAPPGSNITVKDDVLLAGDKLAPYIGVQIKIMERMFQDPVFAGPQKSALIEADETMMLMIRHPPRDGSTVLQVQTYVRLERWLGIITLTTTNRMLTSVRKDYEQFAKSLKIAPAGETAEAAQGGAR